MLLNEHFPIHLGNKSVLDLDFPPGVATVQANVSKEVRTDKSSPSV